MKRVWQVILLLVLGIGLPLVLLFVFVLLDAQPTIIMPTVAVLPSVTASPTATVTFTPSNTPTPSHTPTPTSTATPTVTPPASPARSALLEFLVAVLPPVAGASLAYHFAGREQWDPVAWAALGGAAGFLLGGGCLLWMRRND